MPTLEGDHYVSVGDYIIKGIDNEFYPCKEDVFLETYEAVGCSGDYTTCKENCDLCKEEKHGFKY